MKPQSTTISHPFQSSRTVQLATAAMAAALLAVISQISIPMPTGVPITIQVYGVVLIGVVLGWKNGLRAILVHILLGAVGVPVFSNLRGGLSMLSGLTGGYILGWPVMVVLSGIHPHTGSARVDTGLMLLFTLTGLCFDEFLGGLQWTLLSGEMTGRAVFAYSMAAFVPKDTLLAVLAVFTGLAMRKLLRKAGL